MVNLRLIPLICLFLLGLMSSSCGVKGSIDSGSSSGGDGGGGTPTIWKPFDYLTLTTDQVVLKTMALEPNAVTPPDYGFDEGNVSLRGQFRFDTARKTLVHERSLASGGSWNDFTLFPPDSNGMLGFFKLNQIKKISVLIKGQHNANSSFAQCGLAFGFGTAVGHANAAGASTNLSLAGRNWASATNAAKNPRDYFRISYASQTALEKIVIDAPINSFNAASEWTNFTTAEWREAAGEIDLIGNAAGLNVAGDYITYKMTLDFDKTNRTVTVTISDLGSNVTMTGWGTSKSVVWDYTQAVGATDGVTGSARGGLDLTNVTGATAMSWDDFHKQTFKLGFVGNQMARLCEYSDLQLTFEP